MRKNIKMSKKQACTALCIVKNSSSSLDAFEVVVRVTMDFFEHRYYRLGKILMSLIGQWPYQSTRSRRTLAILILPVTHQIVAHMIGIIKYRHDANILLECLLSNVFEAICVVKYLGFIWNSQKTLKLVNRMRTDWQVWARHREVKILHEYAEWGQKITTLFTALLYASMFLYMIQPMLMKFIDIVLKNGSEPGAYPLRAVYYPVDEQKYWLYLNIYMTLFGLFIETVTASSDIMLILYVQHVCGLFSALGHKLERMGSEDTSVKTSESPYALNETDVIASCIDRHNDAIEYACLIKESYAWNFFFTTVFGIVLIILSGLRMLLNTNDPGATIELVVLALSALFYFFVECCISQMLIDHSISIGYYIHNSQWYRLSTKAQKLLQLMTMFSYVPCQLIAGNVLILSLRNFGVTLRTTMSYFACARSTQNL